jgi:hypothetical protein
MPPRRPWRMPRDDRALSSRGPSITILFMANCCSDVVCKLKSPRVWPVRRLRSPCPAAPCTFRSRYTIRAVRRSIGRVERRRDRFRPMASAVSALSSIVANGHQTVPTVPPPSRFIPYGGLSPVQLEAISGRQSSLHVAAGTFARAADQSLPAAGAADSPARLRQSLPQSGSPPTGVCYDYSAQPSIAEAGPAPASLSKTEGRT